MSTERAKEGQGGREGAVAGGEHQGRLTGRTQFMTPEEQHMRAVATGQELYMYVPFISLDIVLQYPNLKVVNREKVAKPVMRLCGRAPPRVGWRAPIRSRPNLKFDPRSLGPGFNLETCWWPTVRT